MVTKFKTGDIAAVVIVLMIAAVIFITSARGSVTGDYAVITYDGGETTVPLDKNGSGSIDSLGFTLEYEISEGSISVKNCNCPDKICVQTAPVTRPGQSIICMPAHIAITVAGGDADAGSDIVAG